MDRHAIYQLLLAYFGNLRTFAKSLIFAKIYLTLFGQKKEINMFHHFSLSQKNKVAPNLPLLQKLGDH